MRISLKTWEDVLQGNLWIELIQTETTSPTIADGRLSQSKREIQGESVTLGFTEFLGIRERIIGRSEWLKTANTSYAQQEKTFSMLAVFSNHSLRKEAVMFDAYEKQRKEKLREWFEFCDSLEDRLAQAKERLGEKWLFHPSNKVQRRAQPYGERTK